MTDMNNGNHDISSYNLSVEDDPHQDDYLAKCASSPASSASTGATTTLNLRRSRGDNESALFYESDEDNNSIAVHGSSSQQNSKRIKKSNSWQSNRKVDLNNLDKEKESSDEMSKEIRDMVRLAGGRDALERVTNQCQENINNGIKVLEPKHGGDTLLMEKCIQKQPLSDKSFWAKNHAEIYAYANIMARTKPDLLVHRNYQNANALELAALNDKVNVAVFLARLLEGKGFDPNAPNDQGHTVLHLLARKGDECSLTLEALLAMRKKSNPEDRLFRIDVVNQGHKTPLDVAVICSHRFATGKDRAIYTETINLFQEVIFDEAKNLLDN